ncbi:DUF6207 family protein [Streptomyces sp. 4N124]|uniref:DUF6207 family protein n=1 Tax=Streptomyces sp. 4N124 TaxID=3457420 RepID=UPI003FD5C99F
MEPIREAHVAEPGLLVVEVAAADDARAFAFQDAIAQVWETATAVKTTRDPGEPGVRLRLNTDLRLVLPQPDAASGRPGPPPRGSNGPGHAATPIPKARGLRVNSPLSEATSSGRTSYTRARSSARTAAPYARDRSQTAK